MVCRSLNEGGMEFQTDDPENVRLVLYRSIGDRDGIKLFEPHLLVDLVKTERMYSGVSPLHTSNTIISLQLDRILVVSLTGEV